MNGGERSRIMPSILAAAALFTLLQVPAAAGPPQEPRGRTIFKGSCLLEGTVAFTPGANIFTQEMRVETVGDGKCTGTLNGTDIKDAPVDFHNLVRAEGSCLEAETIEPGAGEMTFGGGEVLTYTFEFTYDLVNGTALNYQGTQSGTAHGSGTFRTDRTPPDTLARCATPDGAEEVPIDIELETDSPLVSKKH
jgi:hypothetical protein